MLRKAFFLGIAVVIGVAGSYTAAKEPKTKAAKTQAKAGAAVPQTFIDNVLKPSTAPSGAMSKAATGTSVGVKPGGAPTNQVQFGPPADPAAAGAAAAAPLNAETLAALLTNMGYEITTVPVDGGDPYYDMSLKHGEWSMPLSISLSGNHKYIWFTISLAAIENPSSAPVDRVLKVLEATNQTGPCFFTYNSSNGMIYLQFAATNVDITPTRVRDFMQMMAGHVVSTYDIWNAPGWTASATP